MKWLVIYEGKITEPPAARTHLLELCRALAAQDEVLLMTHSKAEELDAIPGVTARQAPRSHVKSRLIRAIASTMRLRSALGEIFTGFKPDAVYCRGSGFGYGPLLAAKQAGIPAVLEINGLWRVERKLTRQHLGAVRQVQLAAVHWFYNLAQDIEARLADRLVAVYTELADYLHGIGIPDERITVVPNGANTQLFRPLDKSACRRELGLEGNERIVGFAGALSPWQGVDDLIVAFAEADAPNCSIRLLIAGDGIDRTRLEALAAERRVSERVVFLGHQPYHKVPNILAACDLLAAPKKPVYKGSSPLKLGEYLACGRPVIASAIPGQDIVEPEGTGMLFHPGDTRDLRLKLNKMLALPEEELDLMGRRARALAVERYSWEAAAAKIRQFVFECGREA